MLFDKELQRITDMFSGKRKFPLMESVIDYRGIEFTLSMYDGEAGYYQYEMACKVSSRVELNITTSASCDGPDKIMLNDICFDIRASNSDDLVTFIDNPRVVNALCSIFQPLGNRVAFPPVLRLRVLRSIVSSHKGPIEMVFTGVPTSIFDDPHDIENYFIGLAVLREQIEKHFCPDREPGKSKTESTS